VEAEELEVLLCTVSADFFGDLCETDDIFECTTVDCLTVVFCGFSGLPQKAFCHTCNNVCCCKSLFSDSSNLF